MAGGIYPRGRAGAACYHLKRGFAVPRATVAGTSGGTEPRRTGPGRGGCPRGSRRPRDALPAVGERWARGVEASATWAAAYAGTRAGPAVGCARASDPRAGALVRGGAGTGRAARRRPPGATVRHRRPGRLA